MVYIRIILRRKTKISLNERFTRLLNPKNEIKEVELDSENVCTKDIDAEKERFDKNYEERDFGRQRNHDIIRKSRTFYNGGRAKMDRGNNDTQYRNAWPYRDNTVKKQDHQNNSYHASRNYNYPQQRYPPHYYNNSYNYNYPYHQRKEQSNSYRYDNYNRPYQGNQERKVSFTEDFNSDSGYFYDEHNDLYDDTVD